MTPFKCNNPTCQATSELDEEKVDKTSKYIQCSACGATQLNPFVVV